MDDSGNWRDPEIHINFERGDSCIVCREGFLIGGQHIVTSVNDLPCNGYCLLCGQRYIWVPLHWIGIKEHYYGKDVLSKRLFSESDSDPLC